jgi:hypothetical protein
MDIPKMQRIEKLIGYKVHVAPLPDFIAGQVDNSPGHKAYPGKSDKGGFKRRFSKGKSRG